MSRWLVGSSRSRMSGRCKRSWIRAIFVCCPPENSPIGFSRSSSAKPNFWNIVSISFFQLYPCRLSILLSRKSYSASSFLWSSVSASSFSISFFRASHAKTSEKAFSSSSFTGTSPSVKLIWRRKPMFCFPLIVIPQVSSLSRLLISISPAISRSSVVFPQPFLPTIAIFSVSWISKFTLFKIVSAPNCTFAFLIWYLMFYTFSVVWTSQSVFSRSLTCRK